LEAAWADFCGQHSLTDLSGFGNFFPSDEQPALHDLSLLDRTVSFLTSHLRTSIEHVGRWLPEVEEDISQPVTVVFLPYGKYTFGPKPGMQMFSLYPDALPEEAYLFLVHVYYHELSSINDTPNGRRCSNEQLTAEDFREWVRLLIRNEGIGNYAVLGDLIQLRDTHSEYSMRYFTYARKIGDPALLKAAVSILGQAFAGVDNDNVAQFSGGINKIFRNEALPIINLVGIHMAESVAHRYGATTLKNVYQQEARDFFALYGHTDAPFADVLA